MPEDQWKNDPENAVRSPELTKEFVQKWDADLTTIHSLMKLAEKEEDLFVIKGGFAVEAYCGGQLARPHGDIDATYYLKNGTYAELETSVARIMRGEETNWELYKSKPSKIEYREIGEDDDYHFFRQRRLELYIVEEPDNVYETGVHTQKILLDSKGNEILVNVKDLSELVTMKVRNLYMVNNGIGKHGRQTNFSDYTDLKRMLDQNTVGEDRLYLLMSRMLDNISDPTEALAEAKREYDFVVTLLAKLPE